MLIYAQRQDPFETRLLKLHRDAAELVGNLSYDEVLKKIASIALERSGAGYAAVATLDEHGEIERFVPAGMLRTQIEKIPHPPQGFGLIRAMMNTRSAMRIPAISKDQRHSGFPPEHPKMSSFLGVPIFQGQRQIGQIYMTDKVITGEFSEEDQRLMELLAAYAGVAIVNARLFRDYAMRDRALTRQNENLSLLYQLASTLSTSTEVNEILEQGMMQLMDYLRLEVGEIFIKNEDSRRLNLLIHHGEAVDSLWKRAQFSIGESTVGRAAKGDVPIVLNLTEHEYADLNPLTKARGLHQMAVIPMKGRRGVVGVLCVATCHPQPLNEPDVQFAQAIAAWMATAIENIRLNITGRRLAILEERDRIGMDLHDGIIQSIYAVGLTLEHARLLMKDNPDTATSRIQQAVNDLNSTIRDIRAYILDLRPRQLKNENLMEGINRLVQEFRANTLVDVTLNGPKDGVATLPEAQALALFHICQEALANIAKHAKAKRAYVSVWTTSERVLLEVHDDGLGFEQNKTKLSIGHGLSNMETRAINAGGEVDISSEPGGGTTVLAWVPFPDPDFSSNDRVIE
ncbi:MAG TPA: GAF domain-containing sensor histidine kinase [Anaerolineaceae bacterium]|nr:GAF domain-containing sensor histidine kinase [Anaerolineaceae bacterium]